MKTVDTRKKGDYTMMDMMMKILTMLLKRGKSGLIVTK